MTTHVRPGPSDLLQNRLLAALPTGVRERVFPHLRLVDLPLGKVLYESGDTPRYVYFPTDAIVSLLYVMESGASAEISVASLSTSVVLSVTKSASTTFSTSTGSTRVTIICIMPL